MNKLGLAGAIVLTVAVGACSSSGSSTSSGASSSANATASPLSATETFTGTITGATAAKFLNSNASPSFPSLVFTGPVDTTIKGPVVLGSGNAKTATHTFVTPAGKLTVQRTAKAKVGQPTVTGKSGKTCYFTADGGTGTYTVLGSKSTGKFAGATGSGTYAITIVAEANLLSGKTTCSAKNTGRVAVSGASITFKASGPLMLKQ